MRLNPWPIGISLFFCGIFVLNGSLFALAASGYGGMLDQHPYHKGLEYDRVKAEQEALIRSGIALSLASNPIELRARDVSGSPVHLSNVTLRALRPNAPSLDQEVNLVELGAGVYGSPTALTSGRWLIELSATHGEELLRLNRSVDVEIGIGVVPLN